MRSTDIVERAYSERDVNKEFSLPNLAAVIGGRRRDKGQGQNRKRQERGFHPRTTPFQLAARRTARLHSRTIITLLQDIKKELETRTDDHSPGRLR